MDGFVMNNGGKATKAYYNFETNVDGPIWKKKNKQKGGETWVGIGERWSDNYNVSFDLSNVRAGDWTIWASSDITVKSDMNGDGDVDDMEDVSSKRAYSDIHFEIK